MSEIQLIDELTCCGNHNTAMLQPCVEAQKKNWRKPARLHAVQERHLDLVTKPTNRFYWPSLLHA